MGVLQGDNIGLLKRRVVDCIYSLHVFDTFGQVYIACGPKRHDMGMLRKWLEGYGVMKLIIRIPMIMKVYQRGWFQRLASYRMDVFVLFEPRDNRGQLKDVASPVCVSCADRRLKWLKGERTGVKWSNSERVQSFTFLFEP